jgi:hypothetical protein
MPMSFPICHLSLNTRNYLRDLKTPPFFVRIDRHCIFLGRAPLAFRAPKSCREGGKAPRCGLSLARPTVAKLDAKYASGRALDKIANPPIT